jgi:hypothetical protein
MIDDAGEGKVAIMRLFVEITASMELNFPGDTGSRGEDGGPANARLARPCNNDVGTLNHS